MSLPLLNRLLAESPIVVTGGGAVSAAGLTVEDLWQRAVAGPATAREHTFTSGARRWCIPVCAAPALESLRHALLPVRRMDRSVQLAWLAAQQALRESGLDRNRGGLRIGVVVGSSRGPIGKIGEGFDRLQQRRYPPSLSADCTFASASGALAQGLELDGPSATISATCASGAYAIAIAAEQLLLGKADAILVGAAEAPLTPPVIAQLDAAGVLGSHEDPALACRPFDRTRNGLCLGEGAAFLVIETAAGVQRRGATALARLAGWGLCVDDSGRAGVSETGGGTVNAARQALAAAGVTTAEIGYVNTHGTGTRLNDHVEAHALRQLFAADAERIPCTSTKPVTGHCLGATPALEAVICIEALRRQTIPPTLNCHQPDPACALNVQPLCARPARFAHAMSNSLGFWGYHASLIFSTP